MKINQVVRVVPPQCEAGSIRISPNGHVLAAIVDKSAIGLWNIDTGTPLRTLQGRNVNIECFTFTPDGRRIISGNFDSTIKYWDVSHSFR
jgi:WD40 repeat protein